MAVFRDKPYPGMNFLVDLGTGESESPEAGLLEVIIPDAVLQVAEYRNGNDKATEPTKIQTLTRYGNLIVTRGVIGSLAWYSWWNATRNGDQGSIRTIIVSLVSEDRTAVVLTWRFLRARPVVHRFSPLHALTSTGMTETLEIAFERLEME
jgi:phage tail-like protein